MSKKNVLRKGEARGSISSQLLAILIPMIALFIIIVAVIIFTNSRRVIIEESTLGLKNESLSNANDIGATMKNIKGYYDGLAGTLENSDYADNDALKAAMQDGMNMYKGMVNDVYLAFPDKTFIDGGDWVPDADYDHGRSYRYS